MFGAAPQSTLHPAALEPSTNATSQLAALPPPKGVITVAVYGFRDQTGQYKQAPDSSFSTAVSQGAGSMLVKALHDSGWFQPVEREGLQDLLTERKILRAMEQPEKGSDKDKSTQPQAQLPTLTPARLLMEGAIVGYDSTVTTGGVGLAYLGFSLGGQFRKDQVTVNIRAVDINNGTILHSITTTKTIYSTQVQPGVYKFISYKDLLQSDNGYTYNEPVQLAVQEAIEEAVVNLVVEGIYNHSWVLANAEDMNNPLVARVHDELIRRSSGSKSDKTLVANSERRAAPGGESISFLNAGMPAPEELRDIPLRPAAVSKSSPARPDSAAGSTAPMADPPSVTADGGPRVTIPLPSAPVVIPSPDTARQQAEQLEKVRQGRNVAAPQPAAAKSFLSTGGG